METHADKGLSHQSSPFGYGRIGMPITEHPFLGIRSARHRGNGEAWSLSGCRGMRIVQRFEAEINLKRTDGVHWESDQHSYLRDPRRRCRMGHDRPRLGEGPLDARKARLVDALENTEIL